jgi:hypothetical protein
MELVTTGQIARAALGRNGCTFRDASYLREVRSAAAGSERVQELEHDFRESSEALRRAKQRGADRALIDALSQHYKRAGNRLAIELGL